MDDDLHASRAVSQVLTSIVNSHLAGMVDQTASQANYCDIIVFLLCMYNIRIICG